MSSLLHTSISRMSISIILISLTILLRLGTANSNGDFFHRGYVSRSTLCLAPNNGYFSILRLRGAGDAVSDAAAAKELGNIAYKEKKFSIALEQYEKVHFISQDISLPFYFVE